MVSSPPVGQQLPWIELEVEVSGVQSLKVFDGPLAAGGRFQDHGGEHTVGDGVHAGD